MNGCMSVFRTRKPSKLAAIKLQSKLGCGSKGHWRFMMQRDYQNQSSLFLLLEGGPGGGPSLEFLAPARGLEREDTWAADRFASWNELSALSVRPAVNKSQIDLTAATCRSTIVLRKLSHCFW